MMPWWPISSHWSDPLGAGGAHRAAFASPFDNCSAPWSRAAGSAQFRDRERAIVRGVIAIARSLGLGTIAEGVEREDERALLAAEGCDLYQGFLCAEPLDGAALAGLVGG